MNLNVYVTQVINKSTYTKELRFSVTVMRSIVARSIVACSIVERSSVES